ncbi:hypothetical protein WDW37_18480 [Bdellovibrionota bacterium FG-1]
MCRKPPAGLNVLPLEIANEMYKFAFLSKQHQFAKKFPHLTKEELHQKTVAYFVALPKD